jgi:hypothetical protein
MSAKNGAARKARLASPKTLLDGPRTSALALPVLREEEDIAVQLADERIEVAVANDVDERAPRSRNVR